MTSNRTINHKVLPTGELFRRFNRTITKKHTFFAHGFSAGELPGESFAEKTILLMQNIMRTLLSLEKVNASSLSIFLRIYPVVWAYPGAGECVTVFFGSPDDRYRGSVLEALYQRMKDWDGYVTAESGGPDGDILIGFYDPKSKTFYESNAFHDQGLIRQPSPNYTIKSLTTADDRTVFAALNTAGEIVTTPAGHDVISAWQPLIEIIVDDMNDYGESLQGPLTMFTLMSSYLDHGLTVPKKELVTSMMTILETDFDIVFGQPHAPSSRAFVRQCYGDYTTDRGQILSDLSDMSLRELTTVMVFGAHLNSIVLGHGLVTERCDPLLLAQAFCPWLSVHVNRQGTPTVIDIDLGNNRRYHHPPFRDEDYCTNYCLKGTYQDYPRTDVDERCPLFNIMMKCRIFSMLPDELVFRDELTVS